jgi:hypothetical protein
LLSVAWSQGDSSKNRRLHQAQFVQPELEHDPERQQTVSRAAAEVDAGGFGEVADRDGDVAEHHGIETFKVTVETGPGYQPFDRRYRMDDLGPERAFTTGHDTLDYTILDGLVAFAGLNTIANKADGGGTIHYNDVDQNIRPNCFCMAIMAGLAYRWQSLIQNMVEELPNGAGFKVTFFGTGSPHWTRTFTIEELLSLGPNMAALSDDYDASDRAEVWPQLIDMALVEYASQHPGNTGLLPGVWYGSVHTGWYIMTGKQTTSWDASETTIESFVSTWSGNPIFLTSKSAPNATPVDLKTNTAISNSHTWLFLRWDTFAGNPAAVLFNPQGVSDNRTTAGETWISAADVNPSYFAEVIAGRKQ